MSSTSDGGVGRGVGPGLNQWGVSYVGVGETYGFDLSAEGLLWAYLAAPAELLISGVGGNWQLPEGIRQTIVISASTALLPNLLFLSCSAIFLLAIATQSITKPAALLVMQRLESARAGIFTSLAVFASALTGLVAATVKIF